MQHNHFFTAILIGLSALVAVGCSNPDSKYARVEGTITYKGQPIDAASVTFQPLDSDGEPAVGVTDASGRFTLTASRAVKAEVGASPGEYRVLVVKSAPAATDPDEDAFNQGRIDYDEYQRRLAARDSSRSVARPRSLIPEKYNGPNSDLRATVERGKTNTFEFVLVD